MRVSLLTLVAFVGLAACSSGGGSGGGNGGNGSPQPDVFYVRSEVGSDRNDGNSPDSALQTITAAAAKARAGDTIIVGPGLYNEAVLELNGGTEASPILVMADPSGTLTNGPAGQVLVDATGIEDQGVPVPAFRLTNAPFVILDGFQVTGGGTAGILVRVRSNNTTIRNCQVFRNSGDGILVQSSENVTLFNNLIFSNTRRGAAIVGSIGARLINNTLGLNEDRGIFIGTRDNVPSTGVLLRNNIVQDSIAANVQVTTEPESSLEGYDPLVNLVFPDRYQPPDLPRPGDINEDALFVSATLGNYRLTEQSPALNAGVSDSLTAEELRILRGRTTVADSTVDDDGQIDLGFHYAGGPAAPGPDAEVYYVRASGDDTNDGLSPQAAFRTIGRAAREAVAGDQVFVGPGRYREGTISPSSGTSTAPVIFRADPSGNLTGDDPDRVLLDAQNEDVSGFRLSQVEFVTLDGFTITGGRQSGIQVRGGSRRITIQNCEVLANDDGIRIEDSRDVLLFNNLVARNRRRGILIAGTVSGSQNTEVIHNTVTQNDDRGIFIGTATMPSNGTLVQNNIVHTNDNTGIQISDGSEPGTSVLYNLVFPLTNPDAYFPRSLPRPEDINELAEFIGGPLGDFYLDQEFSPAIDSGDPQLRTDLRNSLAQRTTDPDGRPDSGRVDRGYHFPIAR